MLWWVSVQEASSWDCSSLGGFCFPWHFSPTSNEWQRDGSLPSPQNNQYAFEICSNMRYGEAKTSWFIAREDGHLQWKYHPSWPESLVVLSKVRQRWDSKETLTICFIVGLSTRGLMKSKENEAFSQDNAHLNVNLAILLSLLVA